MGKIVYITAETPFGSQETFVLNEMLTFKNIGVDILIIPRDKGSKLFHKGAESLIEHTMVYPWFNSKIFKGMFKYIIRNPLKFMEILINVVIKAKIFKIGMKNFVILPKALYVSEILKNDSISHIHSHWGTTTSTMAYIVSQLTNIPWSLTLHRGDIKENNLLKLKVDSAVFTRCISEHGKKMALSLIGQNYEKKIKIIPVGVESIESLNIAFNERGLFRIIVPASFYLVKGHKYLIEAFVILKKQGLDKFICFFYGNGYLKNQLHKDINNKNLGDWIKTPGAIPHEELMQIYQERKTDVVVLPSINTENGEHEGIPVSLMEAMAYGIPVISTDTGGIPELIGDGSGIMVKEKDPEALAEAITRLMNDIDFYYELAEKGRLKIQKSFNINLITKELLRLFNSAGIN